MASRKGGTEYLTIKEFEIESITDSCTWIIVGPPGSGKCLGEGTEVVTYDGILKKVEDVKLGDMLMGDDNTPRTVLGTTSGTDTLYRITQSCGDTYVVNAPHILCLVYEYEPRVLFTLEEYEVSWMEFGTKQTKYFADESDASDYLTYIINVHHHTIYNYLLIPAEEYYTKRLMGELEEYKGYKSCVVFPDPVASVQDRLNFLASMYESNKGDIEEDAYVLNIPDLAIAKRIKFVSDSLGFHTTIVNNVYVSIPEETMKKNIENGNTECIDGVSGLACYILRIRGDITRIPVPYSSESSPPQSTKVLSDIIIEKLEEGKYYGFELDGNRKFLLGDCTVTHNTTLIENLMYYLKDRYPVAKIFVGTEGAYERFCSIVPPLFVFNHYDEVEEDRHIFRQKACALENGQKSRANYAVNVLDDISDDPKIFKTKTFKGLFKLGSQHWHQLCLFGTQYAIDVPPDIRSAVSYVAIFRQPEERERKKLYDNFGGMAGSFEKFCQLMDGITGDYTCLIFDKRSQSMNIEDTVFYLRTKIMPAKWEFGCKEYRDWGEKRIDPNYIDEVTM